MSGPIDLSVVIPSYGTAAATLACLDSLEARRSEPTAEVLVIDNASPDDSAARIRERHPGVRLIEQPRNLGFAAACNRGWRESRGRAVLFLNSDTILAPDTLGDLLRALDAERDVGAVGPRLTGRDGRLQPSCRRDPSPGALLNQHTVVRHLRLFRRHERRYKMRDFAFDRRADVDVVMGAALLVRREALEAVGALDEGFFMYFEEADLCRRLRDAGHRVVFDPSATLTHTGGESSRRAGAAIEAEYVRSLLRYVRRRAGPIGRLFPALFLPTWLVRRFELLAQDVLGGAVATLIGREAEADRRWRGAVMGFELVTRRLFEVISGAFGT